MTLKQYGLIAVDGRSISTMWQQKVTFLLTILLSLIIGSRLQAQTVTIDANLANTIQTTLNGGSDYTVTSTSDIIVSSSITKSAGSSATLTLKAARHISLQNGANITASNGALNLHLWADSDNSSDGINQIASNINTNGGWLKAGNDNQTATINNVSTRVGGDISFNGSSPQTITTNGGQIDIYGETIVGNTSGLTINSGNGNVTLYGLLNSGNQYTGVNYSGATWLQAQAQADADNNANTYLATITSRLENSIAALSVSYNSAWLGARRESNGFWRWEKGPEAGQGLTYTNWAANEPNNYGTEINGLGYKGENALQFTGANGNWNDLWDNGIRVEIDFLNYYVLETTLAASPVTINAGSGTVTFKAAVGSSKPLSSLSITAATTAINGGSVTTNGSGAGSQSYSGNITLGRAGTTLNMLDTPDDFVLASGKSISNATNADASLTIATTANIILETNSSIESSAGKLNTLLWSDTDANGGGIHINSGANINSNGGSVTLSGGTNYTSGYAKGTTGIARESFSLTLGIWSGILLEGGINSLGGNVILRGEAGAIPTAGAGVGFSLAGVYVAQTGLVSAEAGNISIYGNVGTDVGSNHIIRAITMGDGVGTVSPNKATLSTTLGSVTLAGGVASASASGESGILLDGSQISSTTSGNITLTGTGKGTTDILVSGANTISSASGNIALNMNGFTLYGTGFSLASLGTLTIQPRTAATTIGIGGGAGTLQLPSSFFSTSFVNGFSNITIGNAEAGNITIGGAVSYDDLLTVLTAGNIAINANLTAVANGAGVVLKAGGNISQAALVGVTTSGGDVVYWADAESVGGGAISIGSASSITTSGGHLWMGGGSGSTTWNGLTVGDGYATGVDATGVRDGVLINNATINTSGGDIALYGKSAVSANIEAGIRLNDHLSGSASTVVNSGAGKILLDGIGRGSAGFAGVEFNTTNTAATVRITSTNTTAEAITINSDSQAATASGWGLLFYFGTEISATGSGGGITIIGKINNLGGKAIGFHSPGQTGTRVLANGGPIIFNAITNGTGNSIYAVGNNMVVGQLAGSTVPTSSSNITLNIDHPMTGTSTNVPDLTFSSSGSLAIQPLTANTTIGIGGATGTVQLPASLFTTSFADGFSQITIGGGSQTGNINLNSVNFRDNMHLQTTGTVGVNAGQTITATGIKLQIDNTLGMGAGSGIIR